MPVQKMKKTTTTTPDRIKRQSASLMQALPAITPIFAGFCLFWIPSLHFFRMSLFVAFDALLFHCVGVLDRSDFCRGLAPVGLDLDSELCHGDTEELQESGLVAVESAALLAELVVAVEHDLALVELGRHTPFPDGDFQTVRHGDILVGGYVTTARVDDTGGDGEVSGGLDAGAGVVDLGVVFKVLEDLCGLAVAEEEADAALDVGSEFGETGLVFLGVGHAESLCHDLCLAEEDARVGKVGADVLEVGVAHVLDAKDVDVGEVVGGLADIVEELCAEFLVLLLDLSEVDDLGSL